MELGKDVDGLIKLLLTHTVAEEFKREYLLNLETQLEVVL